MFLPPSPSWNLKPRANGRNIVGQQLPTLLDVTCHVRLHTLLHVVGCCCVLLRKVWNRSNRSANNSQHFFCSVIAEASRNNVGSVCTAPPTLLGPRTFITHGLQRLMGCILSTMHCRSQHCWELLHPFADYCEHARNNSKHCWRNNVGNCCVPLHTPPEPIRARGILIQLPVRALFPLLHTKGISSVFSSFWDILQRLLRRTLFKL